MTGHLAQGGCVQVCLLVLGGWGLSSQSRRCRVQCLAAVLLPVPAACARLSLCATAGKLSPCLFKNKHFSLLDSLPCKNKHSSPASQPGTLAGAHKCFGGTS